MEALCPKHMLGLWTAAACGWHWTGTVEPMLTHCLWGWAILTGISFQVKTIYGRCCIKVIILYKCNRSLRLLSFQQTVVYKAKLNALAWQDAFFWDGKRNALEILPEISRYYHMMLVSFHWLLPPQASQFPCKSSLALGLFLPSAKWRWIGLSLRYLSNP